MGLHARLHGSVGKLLEAFEEATAHVRARLYAAGAGVMAGHVVGGVPHCRHARHVGFGRRQRDACRDGDKCHRHGEDAKGHEPTMQRSFHAKTVPQREGGDKDAACLCSGMSPT